jgi:hypothetical protein
MRVYPRRAGQTPTGPPRGRRADHSGEACPAPEVKKGGLEPDAQPRKSSVFIANKRRIAIVVRAHAGRVRADPRALRSATPDSQHRCAGTSPCRHDLFPSFMSLSEFLTKDHQSSQHLAPGVNHLRPSIVASFRVKTSVPRSPCRRTVVPGSICSGGTLTIRPFTRQSRIS